MTEETVVRENLMTREGYMPYCGNDLHKGLHRAKFSMVSKQFHCSCLWISQYPSEFIKRYIEKWHLDRFNEGDKVRVVKYGHPMWVWKAEWEKYFNAKLTGFEKPPHILEEQLIDGAILWWYDSSPKIVGKEGVIEKVQENQGKLSYAVDGIPEKHAWYNQDQLELI